MRNVGDIRDTFIEKDGKKYERHYIERIQSYNGETINTEYISNTGELSIGATVDYVLETPIDIECTEEQTSILDEIDKTVKTYKGGTHMYSTDEIGANLEVTYRKDLDTMISKINTAIVAMGGV